MPFPESSDLNKVRELLATRARNRKYIRGDNIVDIISKSSGYDRDQALSLLSALKRANEVECQNWYQGEPIGRLLLNLKLSKGDAHLRWLRVLEEEGLKPHDIESLEPIHPFVQDWDDRALSLLVRGLLALREDMPTLRGQSRYAVSARYLLGSSKIIDALPNSTLKAFGIDATALAKPPSYLMTAGPANPEAVLLIENPQAFELAISSPVVTQVALVATFGYGLSRAGDDFGRQLASHIENNDPLIPLVRKGTPSDLETLLCHPKAYFWGDLDMEGLRIFWRLRSELPQLKLSALYIPMINLLMTGCAHPYSTISGKPNQQPWQCQDSLVNHLLGLCADRAIDQECAMPSMLSTYATKPLQWDDLWIEDVRR